ncbi:MAG: class II fumarate hydratase [Simkaniaceae bacterium]|nr:class II fumarate hydratase [Candidatus Sacchlamyda saccharinae]
MDSREEKDSLGSISVPKDRLWGAQTQRSLQYFSIGSDLMPREMITAYAHLKKAAAIANDKLAKEKRELIIRACDEILAGKHEDEFPLHVWMTGSGTQFNMNMNEVIANLCSHYSGKPLGSKEPVHPNDDVNMSQSSNDTFPTAMHIAAAVTIKENLLPKLEGLIASLDQKAKGWKDLVKIGRTHMQDATPLTLGQEISGYVVMLYENSKRLSESLEDVYKLAIGGTALGTGINSPKGFDKKVSDELSKQTGLPFTPALNKFAVMGAHDALVQLSGSLKTTAVSLYKISNDIRLLSSGPRAGINELELPANEPGSSIMPGKVNPTQCEALAMVAIQVIANDTAVAMAGASGLLEMNVYKPVMIYNILQSIQIMADASDNFRKFCVEGMEANTKQIAAYVDRSLMLVTPLSPVIGYDKASEIAHYASEHGTTLKQAALKLGYVSEEEYDKIVNPINMIYPR